MVLSVATPIDNIPLENAWFSGSDHFGVTQGGFLITMHPDS